MLPQLLPDEECTLFAPTDIDFAQNGVGSATESFGSRAGILQCNRYVRFTPESGHLQDILNQLRDQQRFDVPYLVLSILS